MHPDEFSDDLHEISDVADRGYRITEYRRKLAEFEPGHPDRAEYLTYLADDLTDNGELDEARQTYEDALADGGDTVLDPRCGLLSVELAAGNEDRASELLTLLLSLSRAENLVVGDYAWIAESLEEAGRFREALRWFTIPMRDIQPGDVENIPISCLVGRFRVRRQLDLPIDAYDDAYNLWEQLRDRFDDLDDLNDL